MEKEIKTLLNDDILTESASKYGFHKNDLIDLKGFQNFVYEANKNTKSCILRIAHSSHRSLNLTEAELDWITYLFNHGVNVAAPIRSLEGSLVNITHHEDSYFIATAFKKAPGSKPHYQIFMEDKNLIQKLGRTTGKIHMLSKKYKAKKGSARRSDWKDNNYLIKFAEYVPESYANVIEKTKQFLFELMLLPQDRDSYGLIHGDIHLNNFHVHKDDLTLFDFDECEYNWFVADIANPLFYATPLKSDGIELRNRSAKRFFDYFMEGYFQENSLETYWLNKIPLFLRLREILVYSGAFRSLDFNNLHPWSKEMIKTTTINIENDLQFLDIQFT
ncbi:phosphotransferase enzyme family protein [Paenibacillus eucommiae]|uniref:Ser/Thr protein kinase RdoA (MazF antagonist) n=1 Tax=Paenibacillus eucommiae TaxID=1355755 RepID=A0ABS4IQC7_9BACL|nr:phosphotransferase [Paenibacillus eucommiae]MBP1989779.1 Ser/Thr protein kinase RdoA (MazF antagonist) [Paenibacillus eucommiae]